LSSLYDRFLVHVRPGGRILDAGCGAGRDLRKFRERGFNAIGIDASDALVKMAHEYSGAPCFTVRLEEMTYQGVFNGIWSCASLLHFPKHALVPVLRRLNQALVKGGTMFASVQMGQGEAFVPDGRYYAYYQREEFAGLLEGAGFLVVETWLTEDALIGRPAIRWVNVLGRSQ
jgi:SAM-dependent methyltransferase